MTDISEIAFREARDEDGPRVREVVFAVLREYGLQPDPEATDADLFDPDSFYTSRGGVFEVMENAEGEIIGTAGLLPIEGGVVELRKMYVLPEYRGRGLGKLALKRMIGKAGDMGFAELYLETASPLKEAIALYESFGFRPVAEVHTPRCDRAYRLELNG